MGIRYPMALDSDYAMWTAFDNHYWPALYLVDAEGRIRHHWFGEGDYERSERVLQQLLREAGRCPATGPSSARWRRRTSLAAGSRAAFTPATSISSWRLPQTAQPSVSVCSWTERRWAPTTDSTSTIGARAR